MKVPMRYQNTEYDCGTTSFVNSLAYLFDREDVPIELLRAVYRYTLDVETDGIVGQGGTSRTHAEMLARYFVKYANETPGFNIKCKILTKEQVNLDDMRKCLDNNGVIVARCWMEVEHYVIITKIDDNFAYIFDPYYLEEDYYRNDPDVAIVLHSTFSHNRLVKVSRLLDTCNKDFALMEVNSREVILINR